MEATAPGQPTLDELRDLYGFSRIGRATKVYGVIGHPVSHSKSPTIHNACFHFCAHDGVYLPLPVAPGWEPFKATLGAMLHDPHLDFAGASVTIPHKEHLVRYAREDTSRRWVIDERADLCGAANTLVVRESDCLVVNTDIPGIVDPLSAAVGDLSGKQCAILGAGGVARAAAVALLEHNTVVVYARRAEQSAELVRSLAGAGVPGTIAAGDWNHRGAAADIVINCTPIGMATGSDPDGSPLDQQMLAALPDHAVVMDTVYAPEVTPLVRMARERGLRTVTGAAVFLEQAAHQAWLFTGSRPPRDVMAAAAGFDVMR